MRERSPQSQQLNVLELVSGAMLKAFRILYKPWENNNSVLQEDELPVTQEKKIRQTFLFWKD